MRKRLICVFKKIGLYAAGAGKGEAGIGADGHALTRCGGVDVLTVTDVNANMVSRCAPENEVSRLQVIKGNRFSKALLGCCGAGEFFAVLGKNIAG